MRTLSGAIVVLAGGIAMVGNSQSQFFGLVIAVIGFYILVKGWENPGPQ